jgi:hypothetical protein
MAYRLITTVSYLYMTLKYVPFIWYFGKSSKLEKCLKSLKVININTFDRNISVVDHHKHHFLIIRIITGLVSFIDTGFIRLCRSAVRNYMHILTNCIYLWKAHIVNTFWRKFNRHLRWGWCWPLQLPVLMLSQSWNPGTCNKRIKFYNVSLYYNAYL